MTSEIRNNISEMKNSISKIKNKIYGISSNTQDKRNITVTWRIE